MILVNVTTFEISKKFPSARDHFKQAPARVIVFLMHLEVLRKLIDALREQSDLYLRRTCVPRVGFVVAYNFFFYFFYCCHITLLKTVSPYVRSNSVIKTVTAKIYPLIIFNNY